MVLHTVYIYIYTLLEFPLLELTCLLGKDLSPRPCTFQIVWNWRSSLYSSIVGCHLSSESEILLTT